MGHGSKSPGLHRGSAPRKLCAVAESLMTQIRKSKGLSLSQVADVVGTDQANLSRIEKGAQVPKRELARALYQFYDRAVPLGAIYDPEHYASEKRA